MTRIILALFIFVSIALDLSASGRGREETWPDVSLTSGWSGADATEVEKKKSGEEMLEALMGGNSEDCFGKKCISGEQCCQGSACVDVNGAKALGTCLPVYGHDGGEPCQVNGDCAPGYLCGDTSVRDHTRICQMESRDLKKKQYNDECLTSAECDVDKGLCCQIQRRHRMAPRRVCYYFVDPKSCIGKLNTLLKPIHFVPNPFFKARMG